MRRLTWCGLSGDAAVDRGWHLRRAQARQRRGRRGRQAGGSPRGGRRRSSRSVSENQGASSSDPAAPWRAPRPLSPTPRPSSRRCLLRGERDFVDERRICASRVRPVDEARNRVRSAQTTKARRSMTDSTSCPCRCSSGTPWRAARVGRRRKCSHRSEPRTPIAVTDDFNDDGRLDFVGVDADVDVDPDEVAWTGRYIQVLVNRRVPLPGGGVWFGDDTDTHGSRGRRQTTPKRLPNGEPLHNGSARFAKHDVDRDGCIDLVMVRQRPR